MSVSLVKSWHVPASLVKDWHVSVSLVKSWHVPVSLVRPSRRRDQNRSHVSALSALAIKDTRGRRPWTATLLSPVDITPPSPVDTPPSSPLTSRRRRL